MSGVDQHARDQIAELRAVVMTHVSICEEGRKADEQWRSSATRVLQEIKESLSKHINTIYNRLWAILWAAAGIFGAATVFMFVKLMGW